MLNKPIVVVGSSNIDLVAKTPRFPMEGETLSGTDFYMVPGGKGANQAVAAAKLGGEVLLVARLGNDIFASKSLNNFESVGVNSKYIKQLEGVPSGVALIAVDGQGKNSIIVIPGANHSLSACDVFEAESDIASAGVVVCQLEVKMEVVEAVADIANKYEVPFILDPAPAAPLSDQLLKKINIIKPNEIETQAITGVSVTDSQSAEEAANVLLGKGVECAIITLGDKGVLLANKNGKEFIAAKKVRAIDSTAAGDAFTGALAYCISKGQAVESSVQFANYVAALSVTKFGAQSSMPTLDEVNSFISSNVV